MVAVIWGATGSPSAKSSSSPVCWGCLCAAAAALVTGKALFCCSCRWGDPACLPPPQSAKIIPCGCQPLDSSFLIIQVAISLWISRAEPSCGAHSIFQGYQPWVLLPCPSCLQDQHFAVHVIWHPNYWSVCGEKASKVPQGNWKEQSTKSQEVPYIAGQVQKGSAEEQHFFSV